MARDIIVMGASAGGVNALRQVVSGFPPDWNAIVLVAIHLPAEAESALPEILGRAGPLPSRHASDGERLAHGTIYVARPGHHMAVLGGSIRLAKGPRQTRRRLSIDLLFRSAARSYGPRVIGTILTGALSDGSAGLRSIRARGGVAVVQDPEEAEFPWMPRSALQAVEVNHCVRLDEIAPLLRRLSESAQSPESGTPFRSDRPEGLGPGTFSKVN